MFDPDQESLQQCLSVNQTTCHAQCNRIRNSALRQRTSARQDESGNMSDKNGALGLENRGSPVALVLALDAPKPAHGCHDEGLAR